VGKIRAAQEAAQEQRLKKNKKENSLEGKNV